MESDGAIVGYTHGNVSSVVILNVYTTSSNQDVNIVHDQNMISFTINSDLDVSTSYYTVVFVNHQGQQIFTELVLEGDILEIPDDLDVSRESSVQYDYIFEGWDYDSSAVTENLVITPTYRAVLREYEVKYLDEDGTIVKTLNLKYGTTVDQLVEAPEKKGGLFTQYKFIRWGEDGQIVEGNTSVMPVYEKSLTGMGTALVFFIAIALFAGMVAIASKKKI